MRLLKANSTASNKPPLKFYPPPPAAVVQCAHRFTRRAVGALFELT